MSESGRGTMKELVDLIGKNLRKRKDSFCIADGLVECDLGGKFIPIIPEMHEISDRRFDGSGNAFDYNINSVQQFFRGDAFAYNNVVLRLYYEALRQNANLAELGLRISGVGKFVVSIVADGKDLHKIALQKVVNFGSKLAEIKLKGIDPAGLLVNCSLYLDVKCISQDGMISGFRWLGYTPERTANLGERVILLRTFGALPTIRKSLEKICSSLGRHHKEILSRTIFVIYDAGVEGHAEPAMPESASYARIIELTGPNYGGGGNASLLASIFNRLPEEAAAAISEILILDDDAKIDAETIARQDAFITARKENVISSAVVLHSGAPYIIQEFGAAWGRFFSPVTGKVKITRESSQRALLPYLIRSTRDLSKECNARYIGIPEDVEFATFIFISFPCALLRKIGAPLPFFLRNDDVEICLRAIKNGARVVINPNLQVWHDSAHNPVSEFYAIFHGLVVNCAYGGLNKIYFYTVILERIAKLARAGNCLLLQAYVLALEKFAQGPGWMRGPESFEIYAECRNSIKTLERDYMERVPFEVVDVEKDDVHIISLINQKPDVGEHENVVFKDTQKSSYFVLKKDGLETLIERQLEKCVFALDRIANGYQELVKAWAAYVAEFNDITFWDMMLGRDQLRIVKSNFEPAAQEKSAYVEDAIYAEPIQNTILTDNDDLPKGFSAAGYLAKNPDVGQSGMDPVTHWLKYGRFEGRKF